MGRDLNGDGGCTNGQNGQNGLNGLPGVNGQNGINGLDATISIGVLASLPYGSSPMITNTGTSTNSILNFALPNGAPGVAGTNGIDAIISSPLFHHIQSKWLSGVATTMTITNSGYGLMAGFNGPGVPALNDSFETRPIQITPGTYNMKIVTSRLSNRGIVNWYMDNVSIGSIDCYLNGVDSIIQTIPGVVVPSSVNNLHTFKGVVTKNVSSTGYYIYMSAIWFEPQ
jgi:hypothetical protein